MAKSTAGLPAERPEAIRADILPPEFPGTAGLEAKGLTPRGWFSPAATRMKKIIGAAPVTFGGSICQLRIKSFRSRMRRRALFPAPAVIFS